MLTFPHLKAVGIVYLWVIVDDLKSVYGVGKTNGYAKIYKSEDLAKKYENEYLLKRNGYSDKPAEEEAQE